MRIARRRRLGYAEFGDPDGRLVLWFHGTPGGRRQIPPAGRRAADELGLRVVCVARPGVGGSSPHHYHRIREWARDIEVVADHFGADRFAVVGLSGGGPYALACGHDLPDRVVGVGVLGGVCPTRGVDAVPGGPVALAARFRLALQWMRVPFGAFLWGVTRPLIPASHLVYRGFSRAMPVGDQAVLSDPGIEAMFIDDLLTSSNRGFGAIAHDVALFGRHWGFHVADIQVPVRWWHGDADSLVPLSHAELTVPKIPDAELYLRHDESHLGGFAAADDVLHALAPFFP